jgi:hypothetical protein
MSPHATQHVWLRLYSILNFSKIGAVAENKRRYADFRHVHASFSLSFSLLFLRVGAAIRDPSGIVIAAVGSGVL